MWANMADIQKKRHKSSVFIRVDHVGSNKAEINNIRAGLYTPVVLCGILDEKHSANDIYVLEYPLAENERNCSCFIVHPNSFLKNTEARGCQ